MKNKILLALAVLVLVFSLTGCEITLEEKDFVGTWESSDFNWYEIGDVICIGDRNALYDCFPKNTGDVVAKARLATEELYKLKKRSKH